MATIQFERDNDGVQFIDGRKRWIVNSEAAVDLLYGPLLGLHVMGTYHLILAYASHAGEWQGMGIRKLAKRYHVGTTTWIHEARLLEKVGLIEIKVPHEDERRKGISTAYVVVDVPAFIPEALIDELTGGHPENYECGAPWWMDDSAYRDLADKVDEREEGVPDQEHGCSQIGTPVFPDRNLRSGIPVLDPCTEDQSQFLEPEIRDSEPPASPAPEPIPASPVDQAVGAVTDKGSDGASRSSRLTLQEAREIAAQRSAGVAGKAVQGEERTINMNPGKASVTTKKDELPDVCKLAIRSLHAVQARADGFTDEQIGELTTMPIRLHSGEIMPFTVAELYTQHLVEFDAWVMGLPAVLKAHNHRLTPANMVKYMRAYDMNVVGFVAFMATKGNFGLQTAPKREVVYEKTNNPYNPQPPKIVRRGEQL